MAVFSEWKLTNPSLIADTNSSLVYRCDAPDGSRLILKNLKPTGLREAKGFDYLDWRDGCGAVRLLARQGNCGLLQDGGSMRLKDLHDKNGDAAANAVILNVVKRLHAPGNKPVPASLISMREHFAALYAVAGSTPDDTLAEPLRWAVDLLEELLTSQMVAIPLHGDIHHENIVSHDGSHWLAIDPQGLVGDPAYEVANVFGNPLNAQSLVLNADRAKALISTFGAGLDLPEARILGFAAVHAAVSVCWSLRGGSDLETDAHMRERFDLLLLLRGLCAESDSKL